MLVDTPQIVWHGGEDGKNAPILSLDTHPLPLERRHDVPDDGHPVLHFILATAGTDAEVRLWKINKPTPEDTKNWEQRDVSGRSQSFVASLGGHQRGVNVVRFSPNGLNLASASDGGTVVIWSVEDLAAWSTIKADRDTRKTILRGATEDIYDLAWSPDSEYIACGSIDRRAHVWEVSTKRSIATLEDHANYVQGTAWDPLSKYLATQSSDRSCRVYQITQDGSTSSGAGRPAVKCCNVIKSCVIASDDGSSGSSSTAGNVQEGTTVLEENPPAVDSDSCKAATSPTEMGAGSHIRSANIEGKSSSGGIRCTAGTVGAGGAADSAQGKGSIEERRRTNEDGCTIDGGSTKDKTKPVQRKSLFVDETVTSFFRRLSWSPDGAFLITPTAQHWDAGTRKTQFCTYLFVRGQFVKPALCFTGLNKPSVAVRCNPRLFALKGSGESEAVDASICNLPYRAVFAVVSLDAVVVYDTEHSHPLTIATGLHFSALTDACWSSDGLSLFVSSTDGYVSKIHFDSGELGDTIPAADVPLQTRRLHPVIYDWQPKTTLVEVATKTTAKLDLPSTDSAHEASSARKSNGGSTLGKEDRGMEEPPNTARDPHAVAIRLKKKIAPTFVTALPALDRAKPGDPLPAVAPSPATPSERKKRRITPTLVVLEGANESGDARVSTGTTGIQVKSTSATAPAAQQPGNGQGSTPRKKRLAPTLVAPL
ncbi:unnamed protein product [Scytosiphon promiscuus]